MPKDRYFETKISQLELILKSQSTKKLEIVFIFKFLYIYNILNSMYYQVTCFMFVCVAVLVTKYIKYYVQDANCNIDIFLQMWSGLSGDHVLELVVRVECKNEQQQQPQHSMSFTKFLIHFTIQKKNPVRQQLGTYEPNKNMAIVS